MSQLYFIVIVFLSHQLKATTLQLQSLDITYSSYSYGGAAAFYNGKLYSWDGYECNSSNTSSCSKNSTNKQYTLDISALSLTSNREIIASSIATQWQSTITIDPFHSLYTWPLMISGTGTSSYTYLNNYGWILFPCSATYRTRIALKYDLNQGKYVNFTEYNEIIPTVSDTIWSGTCNTNDQTYIYAIGGRGQDNYDQSNKVYRYHIQNDTWQQLSNLLLSVFNPSCAVANDILYSLGGQDAGGMNSRISTISAYIVNTWTKVGDLNTARHNAISFTHPNNWILTIGGMNKTDNPANIIEIFDPDSGSSFDTNMRFVKKRFYQAQYIYDVNTQIIFLWGGLRAVRNDVSTVYNDIQYIILSKNDAIYPSNAPTVAPSYSPSITPSVSPTAPPSNYPSFPPSFAPTISPTFVPTGTPTIAAKGVAQESTRTVGIDSGDIGESGFNDNADLNVEIFIIFVCLIIVVLIVVIIVCVVMRRKRKQMHHQRHLDGIRYNTNDNDTIEMVTGENDTVAQNITEIKHERNDSNELYTGIDEIVTVGNSNGVVEDVNTKNGSDNESDHSGDGLYIQTEPVTVGMTTPGINAETDTNLVDEQEDDQSENNDANEEFDNMEKMYEPNQTVTAKGGV